MKWNKLTAFVSFALLFWACSESDNVSGENRTASGMSIPCNSDDCDYMTDERDGKSYRIVKIGDQWWMAENLNFDYKVDSMSAEYREKIAPIAYMVNDSTFETFCNTDDCTVYGRYYTWAAAMDGAAVFSDDGITCGFGKAYPLENGRCCRYVSYCYPSYPIRGVCPKGWHLPSNDDWKKLYSVVKYHYAMHAKGFEEWSDATDAFGFSALPAGGNSKGKFYDVGSFAYFWSSGDSSLTTSNCWYLNAGAAGIMSGDSERGRFNVRCVKD